MFGLNKIIPTDPDINFLRLRRNFLIFSITAIIISISLLFFKGLNLGIDFKGGTLIEISTKNTSISELRDILSTNYDDVSLQEFGDKNTQPRYKGQIKDGKPNGNGVLISTNGWKYFGSWKNGKIWNCYFSSNVEAHINLV